MTAETRADDAWRALRADLNNNVGFGAGLPSALVDYHRPLIEAALAAQPAAGEGLDVERLARALRVVRPWKGNPVAWSRTHAVEIAREYAALQPASEERT